MDFKKNPIFLSPKTPLIIKRDVSSYDISNIEEAKVGDEVVLIGKQGDLEIKVSAFSEISNELNYEILAHLSESIPRIIINIAS